MRTIVVLPTYNERENVVRLLGAVRSTLPAADILVVDDNSPDGTATLVEETAGELGQIKLLRRPGKHGLGSAYRDGFTVALDESYDTIVSMDVDFSHDPAVLPELTRLIDAGADAVIGSRYVPGGATVDWPAHRRWLSRWGNRYTSFVLGLQVRDCTSGYRAYRAEALRAIDPASTTAEGYAFLTELVRRLVRQGAKVMETPIVFTDRRYGESKMSGRIIVESMLLVTRWGARDLLGRPGRMKLTGERPLAGKTPPGLLALHEAGYREVIARLGPGRVLDLGCGVGDYSQQLAGAERSVVGVDYDPATAREAAVLHPGLRTVAGDGARVPLRAGSVDFACSSHLIEHFHDPEPHVAEMARTLTDDGTAFVITPNAPADFENPYHVHLFEPDALRDMLARHFHDVDVLGLDGDAVVKADFERRRRLGRALLRIDVLDLRRRLPQHWYEAFHAAGRRLVYPLVNRRARQGPPVHADRFHTTAEIDPTTLVLFAVAARPRRSA